VSRQTFLEERKKLWHAVAEMSKIVIVCHTYLFGGDHNTNLLNCLSELIGLNSAIIVQIKVLECLHENSLLVGGTRRLLGKFRLQSLLKAA